VSCAVGYSLEQLDCPDESIQLQRGDRFVLASDGIENLSRPAIESLLAAIEAQASPRQDNATIVALFVGGEDA